MNKVRLLIASLCTLALALSAFLIFRTYFSAPTLDTSASASLNKLESEFPGKPPEEKPPPPPDPNVQPGRPAKR